MGYSPRGCKELDTTERPSLSLSPSPFSEAVHIEENLLLKINACRNYSFVAIRRIAMWKEKASEHQVI